MRNPVYVLKDSTPMHQTPRRGAKASPTGVDIRIASDLLDDQFGLVLRLSPRGHWANTEARASGTKHLESLREQIVAMSLTCVLRSEVTPYHAQAGPREIHSDPPLQLLQLRDKALGRLTGAIVLDGIGGELLGEETRITVAFEVLRELMADVRSPYRTRQSLLPGLQRQEVECMLHWRGSTQSHATGNERHCRVRRDERRSH